MAALDIPELIFTILHVIKEDKLTLSRCLRINKLWRETLIENAEEFLEDDVYSYCQAAVVPAGCDGASNNFEFSIPSIDAQLLVITGGLQVKRDPHRGTINLSFVSQRAAELWFRSARRFVDRVKHLRPSQLSKISVTQGKIMPPVVRHRTGQLFFWTYDSFMFGAPSIEEFTLEVRRALQKTDPTVVIGGRTIRLIGFDGRDRLWFRYGNQYTVHAISATEHVTVKPKSSIEAGLKLPEERSGHFHVIGDGRQLFEQLALLDKQGRFFFGDNFGVHVIHPDAPEHFEYHPIYKINYELNKVSSSPNFCPIIQMTSDITGKVFVWSAQGYSDRTIGYWSYDGSKWTNVSEVPAIKDMFVRVYGKVRQIWISYGNQTFVLEEPVDNTEAPKKVVLKDLTAASTIFAKSHDNTRAVLCFSDKSVLLESTGNNQLPNELPPTVHRLLKSTRMSDLNEKSNNTIKDGIIYFSDEKKIVAASLDGTNVEPYHCTETANNFHLGVMHVGSKTTELSRRKVPLIYLRDGNVLDTSVKFVHREGIPAMKYINEPYPSYPSPSGGIYLKNSYWDGLNLPKPSNLELPAFDAFIYGKEGAYIIGHSKTSYTLHYKGETFQAADMCSLADAYYDKLVEVLPYPPIPSYADSHNIINDGQGNLWCLDYSKAGVRTRDKLMLVDTTVHKSKEHDWVTMYKIAPLGNGTAVLLSVYYKSMLLRVQNGSLIVEDTPVPIPVDRIPGGAGFFTHSAFYDKSGEVYIACDFRTYACKSGQVLNGEMRLIDRHGGKWFVAQNSVMYMTGNTVYTVSVGQRLSLGEDYLLDHAVWVEVQGGLARIQFTGKGLQVVEEIKMVLDPWAFCTAKAARHVLWIKTVNNAAGTACYVLDEKYLQ